MFVVYTGECNLMLNYYEWCYLWVPGVILMGFLKISRNKITPYERAAMVRDSSKCETILTSRQLRIKNCHDSTLKISVCSKIALEESTGLKFARNPNEKVGLCKTYRYGNSRCFVWVLEFF